MKNGLKIAFLFCAVVFFAACNDDDSNKEHKSRLKVSLTDAPGDYEHVYIDVRDIKINGNNAEASIGEVNAEIYDLLELTGGMTALLADQEVPSGMLSMIRLVLGENNSIVVEGQTYPLQTPSAMQSGLKVQINQTLLPGITYEYIIDFDVEESIVVQGTGEYLLKPVLRAEVVAETGAISGEVLPLGVPVLVTASNEEHTISAYTNSEGAFLLHGVPEGIYTLTIEPDPNSDFETVVLENVAVIIGEVTSVGIITLP